jgi:hypothetical protein
MATRTITLQHDYGFRPTLPLLHDIPDEFRDGVENGAMQLVMRRSITPNAWYIVPADFQPDPDKEWPVSQTLCKLDEAPGLALFTLQDESRRLVDYGPHMQRYIATMAQTSSFDDQGRPEWSRYALNVDAMCKQAKRLARAETAAGSFNLHAGRERRVVSALTDDEVLVLALGKDNTAIWMYRSLAGIVLQLVRAGHGTVLAEGRFLPNESSATIASQVKARRDIKLCWTNPEAVEKRIAAYYRNPKHRYTNFKGKLPELAYPIG